MLKACVGLLNLNKGKEVHFVVKQLGLESEVLVANALVDIYCKYRCVSYACKVFDRMINRDACTLQEMLDN